jgi:hypothetical protein
MLFFSSSSSFYVRKTAIFTITTRNLQYVYKKNIGYKFLSTSKTTATVIQSNNNNNDNNNYRNVLVPIANGTEEIEAVTIIDTLVRSGASVTIASIHNNDNNNNTNDSNSDRNVVICSRGVRIQANKFISDCIDIDWDLIVCPGGMPGAENLRDSVELKELLLRQEKDNKLIGKMMMIIMIMLLSMMIYDDDDDDDLVEYDFEYEYDDDDDGDDTGDNYDDNNNLDDKIRIKDFSSYNNMISVAIITYY